jgi:hypothetical protein
MPPTEIIYDPHLYLLSHLLKGMGVNPTDNVFCSTGPGGGIDPTCKKGEGGRGFTRTDVPDASISNPLYDPDREDELLDWSGQGKQAKYFNADDIEFKTLKRDGQLQKISTSKVISIQDTVNPNIVNQYRDKIAEISSAPDFEDAPAVVKMGNEYVIVDGNHRAIALKDAGKDEMWAVVIDPNRPKTAATSKNKGDTSKVQDQIKELEFRLRSARGQGERVRLRREIRDLKDELTVNVFCSTGPGGGIDPTCSKGSGEKVVRESKHSFQAQFEHEGVKYNLAITRGQDSFEEVGDRAKWDIEFLAGKGDRLESKGSTGVAGSSALGAMRKIGSLIDSWVADEKPYRFGFNAAPNETGRVRLYERLAKALAEKHGYTVSRVDAGTVSFSLRKAPATNAFCPTGPGGGIDPTCSPGGKGKSKGKRILPYSITKDRPWLNDEEKADYNRLFKRQQELFKKQKAGTASASELAESTETKRKLNEYSKLARERETAVGGGGNEKVKKEKVKIKKGQIELVDKKKVKKEKEEAKPKVPGSEIVDSEIVTREQLSRLSNMDFSFSNKEKMEAWLNTYAKDHGPIAAHGMSKAEDSKRIIIDGVEFIYSKDVPLKKVARTLAAISDPNIPPSIWDVNKRIIMSTQRNDADAMWAVRYNKPDFRSLATGGDGQIVVYNGEYLDSGSFYHEAGHNLATREWGSTHPDTISRYGQAQRAEKPVSNYGSNSSAEDFAEAVKLYVSPWSKKRFKKEFPLKHSALEEIIKGQDQSILNREANRGKSTSG